MPPLHTGFELSLKISEFLNDWGIEKKIFSLTLDNASANDNMQEHLKNALGMHNWLLYGGEFFSCVLFCTHLESYCARGIKSS